MSEIWQNLLSQVEKKEETTVQPTPTNPMPVQNIPTNDQVLGNLLAGPNVYQPIPTIIVDDEDDTDTEEDDFEDGVDTPSQNNFTLGLLNPTLVTTPVVEPNPQPNQFDISTLFNPAPATNVTPVKRGRGRPPKANNADAVMNLLPNSIENNQDLSKSQGNISETFTPSQQTSKDVIIAIPKKTFTDVGESLQRIASAFISIGKS